LAGGEEKDGTVREEKKKKRGNSPKGNRVEKQRRNIAQGEGEPCSQGEGGLLPKVIEKSQTRARGEYSGDGAGGYDGQGEKKKGVRPSVERIPKKTNRE